MDKFVWDNVSEAKLTDLWAGRMSASEISEAMGGCSRSAICGKAFRMKLPRRRAPAAPRIAKPKANQIRKRPGVAALVPRPVAPPRPMPVVPTEATHITILSLTYKTCKWPIGIVGSPDFCFCGHGPRDGSPYCEYHAKKAYQPVKLRTGAFFRNGAPANARLQRL